MAKYIDMHCHLDGGYNTDAALVAGAVYNATSPGDWADIIARINDDQEKLLTFCAFSDIL